MEKLAIDGGRPVRKEILSYGRQWIDDDDKKIVVEALSSDFLTNGPYVKKLEEKISEYTGAKYCVVCSSGTAALHISCLASGIGEGDEVIVSSMTFSATVNAICYCKAIPIFADIDNDTYNIDVNCIKKLITKKTKAIIAVDYTGEPVDIDAIRKICEENNLIFIEDAAHSFGSKYNGKKIGELADFTTFSFHPVKTITGGEGGAVTTNSLEYYKKLKLYSQHGIVQNIISKESWYKDQILLGYNYRMSDINAALVISQLNKIDKFVNRRKEITQKYDEEFSKIPELKKQKSLNNVDTCRHIYILRLNLKKIKCSRNQFMDAMEKEGIKCFVHYLPVYLFSYYKNLGYKEGICPNAENLYNEMMSIPLYPKMNNKDVKDVIIAVKKIIEVYRKEFSDKEVYFNNK